MRRISTGKARTVAVLSSIAMLGGGATALAASGGGQETTARTVHAADAGSTSSSGPVELTSGEQTALAAVQSAIKSETSSIATPILDKAVSAGTITSAQEQDLLTLLENGPGGAGPGGRAGEPPMGATAPSSS